MQSAEASGRTVEDALRAALAQLGAREEEVEFVVLDEGRKGGLFGRGGRDALVRVTRLEDGPESQPAAAGSPEPRSPRETDRGPRGGERPRGARGGRPPGGPGRRESTMAGFERPQPEITEADFGRPAGSGGAPRPAGGGRSRGGRGGGRPAAGGPPRESSEPRESRRRERPERPEKHIEPDINGEEVDVAAHVIDDILRILDIDADLTIREPLTAGDGLGSVSAVVDISGQGLGLLIGRRGDTLIALQYLVNLIVTRRFPEKAGVTIDVEYYRHRREEQIMSLATRMAERVRQTGSAITLEPMSPAERRIIHVSFAEDPEIETNSVGEGENRKVVISLRN